MDFWKKYQAVGTVLALIVVASAAYIYSTQSPDPTTPEQSAAQEETPQQPQAASASNGAQFY